MTHFNAYRDSFPNARLSRSLTGVLEVALHTDGGTLIFNGHTHEQFVDLFHAIGADRDNRAVILTGSGGSFMEDITLDGFDFFTPQGYDKIYREGRKVLMNLLDIEVPLIAAVNGPMRLHTEYILLADIVLAAPSAVFQDKPHFEFGIVSGDGVHLLWQEAIGTIRGRYFILTRQELDAETAKAWGAVNEVVPADRLLARAREIGEGLAALPPLATSYTRIAMTQKLRRIIDEGVTLGLALEGISVADVRAREPRVEPSARRAHAKGGEWAKRAGPDRTPRSTADLLAQAWRKPDLKAEAGNVLAPVAGSPLWPRRLPLRIWRTSRGDRNDRPLLLAHPERPQDHDVPGRSGSRLRIHPVDISAGDQFKPRFSPSRPTTGCRRSSTTNRRTGASRSASSSRARSFCTWPRRPAASCPPTSADARPSWNGCSGRWAGSVRWRDRTIISANTRRKRFLTRSADT